ncbi:MAG: hypothetical protein MJ185_00665 [Treponema sp.]|nr:hypothetical protein [Treponema sp.]
MKRVKSLLFALTAASTLVFSACVFDPYGRLPENKPQSDTPSSGLTDNKPTGNPDETPDAVADYVGTWVTEDGYDKIQFTSDGEFKMAEIEQDNDGNCSAIYFKGTYTVKDNVITGNGNAVSFDNEGWFTKADLPSDFSPDAELTDLGNLFYLMFYQMLESVKELKWNYTVSENTLVLSMPDENSNPVSVTYTKSASDDMTIEVPEGPAPEGPTPNAPNDSEDPDNDTTGSDDDSDNDADASDPINPDEDTTEDNPEDSSDADNDSNDDADEPGDTEGPDAGNGDSDNDSGDTDEPADSPADGQNPLKDYSFKPIPAPVLPATTGTTDFPFETGVIYNFSRNGESIIFDNNGRAFYHESEHSVYELSYTVDAANNCFYTKITKVPFSSSMDSRPEMRTYEDIISYFKDILSSKTVFRENIITDETRDMLIASMYFLDTGNEKPSEAELEEYAKTKTDNDCLNFFIQMMSMEMGLENSLEFEEFAKALVKNMEDTYYYEFNQVYKFSYSYNEQDELIIAKEFIEDFSFENLIPYASVELVSETINGVSFSMHNGSLSINIRHDSSNSSGHNFEYKNIDETTLHVVHNGNSEHNEPSYDLYLPYTFTAPVNKDDTVLTITYKGNDYHLKYYDDVYNSPNYREVISN